MSKEKKTEPGPAALIDLPELGQGAGTGAALLQAHPALLRGVNVKVSVLLGQTETSLAELLAWRANEVLALDRLLEQPLDILVNEAVVARGQLVAVGEHFGVRLTEVAPHAG